jgi:hypothetical protein
VKRRSKFAQAAEEWFERVARVDTATTRDLWEGLCTMRPDLTTPSESRKTPKATCMRDLRLDPAFEVGAGRVRFKAAGEPIERLGRAAAP